MDSHGTNGWTTDLPSDEVVLVNSVGWIVFQNDKVVTICPHISTEELPQRCGDMTIPVSAIVRIEEMVVKKDA